MIEVIPITMPKIVSPVLDLLERRPLKAVWAI
jgi:hypothetical protein